MRDEQGTDTDEGTSFYTVWKTTYYAKPLASSSRKDNAKLKIEEILDLFICEEALLKLSSNCPNFKSV